MSLLLALMITAAVQPTGAPSIESVRSAIWADVQLNATIGNSNEEVSWDWAFGLGSRPPKLTIAGLQCRQAAAYSCAFELLRTPNEAASADDKAQARRLLCTASFKWSPKDHRWAVSHFPPPAGRGHTHTSMHCDQP
jgi:hypothetical protein